MIEHSRPEKHRLCSSCGYKADVKISLTDGDVLSTSFYLCDDCSVILQDTLSLAEMEPEDGAK
jgi:hypothetical protein